MSDKKKGIEFTIDIEEITDFDKFMGNKECILELQKLVNNYDYFLQIGFNERNILMCTGKIISYTKKECECLYTLFKKDYQRIIEKYYGKVKPIDKMKLYFTTNF